MNIFGKDSGRKINVFFSPLLAIAGMLILLNGCKTVDTMTGKDVIMQEKSALEQQLAACDAKVKKIEKEKADLKTDKSSLEKQLGDSNTKGKALEKKLADTQDQLVKKEIALEKLEKSAKGGMSIVLFGGDIIYKVETKGYNDYRAGLRYRTLRDSAFAKALDEFESRLGGDSEMIKVLKEIDITGDRFIDSNEAKSFRNAEEDKYSQMQ